MHQSKSMHCRRNSVAGVITESSDNGTQLVPKASRRNSVGATHCAKEKKLRRPSRRQQDISDSFQNLSEPKRSNTMDCIASYHQRQPSEDDRIHHRLTSKSDHICRYNQPYDSDCSSNNSRICGRSSTGTRSSCQNNSVRSSRSSHRRMDDAGGSKGKRSRSHTGSSRRNAGTMKSLLTIDGESQQSENVTMTPKSTSKRKPTANVSASSAKTPKTPKTPRSSKTPKTQRKMKAHTEEVKMVNLDSDEIADSSKKEKSQVKKNEKVDTNIDSLPRSGSSHHNRTSVSSASPTTSPSNRHVVNSSTDEPSVNSHENRKDHPTELLQCLSSETVTATPKATSKRKETTKTPRRALGKPSVSKTPKTPVSTKKHKKEKQLSKLKNIDLDDDKKKSRIHKNDKSTTDTETSSIGGTAGLISLISSAIGGVGGKCGDSSSASTCSTDSGLTSGTVSTSKTASTCSSSSSSSTLNTSYGHSVSVSGGSQRIGSQPSENMTRTPKSTSKGRVSEKIATPREKTSRTPRLSNASKTPASSRGKKKKKPLSDSIEFIDLDNESSGIITDYSERAQSQVDKSDKTTTDRKARTGSLCASDHCMGSSRRSRRSRGSVDNESSGIITDYSERAESQVDKSDKTTTDRKARTGSLCASDHSMGSSRRSRSRRGSVSSSRPSLDYTRSCKCIFDSLVPQTGENITRTPKSSSSKRDVTSRLSARTQNTPRSRKTPSTAKTPKSMRQRSKKLLSLHVKPIDLDSNSITADESSREKKGRVKEVGIQQHQKQQRKEDSHEGSTLKRPLSMNQLYGGYHCAADPVIKDNTTSELKGPAKKESENTEQRKTDTIDDDDDENCMPDEGCDNTKSNIDCSNHTLTLDSMLKKNKIEYDNVDNDVGKDNCTYVSYDCGVTIDDSDSSDEEVDDENDTDDDKSIDIVKESSNDCIDDDDDEDLNFNISQALKSIHMDHGTNMREIFKAQKEKRDEERQRMMDAPEHDCNLDSFIKVAKFNEHGDEISFGGSLWDLINI